MILTLTGGGFLRAGRIKDSLARWVADEPYGDLTAQGGVGRAFAVTERLLGQIYLVTTVAALVGNLGGTRTPAEEMAPERDERGSE